MFAMAYLQFEIIKSNPRFWLASPIDIINLEKSDGVGTGFEPEIEISTKSKKISDWNIAKRLFKILVR